MLEAVRSNRMAYGHDKSRSRRTRWIVVIEQGNLSSIGAYIKTHNLELRPKTHYPTKVRLGFEKFFEEPVPVEGFLVRLTAANGRQARFGRLFYKRLYFTTHDHMLFYCSPSKAAPPPPPKMFQEPNSQEVDGDTNEMPLMWATTPYKLKNGHVQWLEESTSPNHTQWYDTKAKIEYERCVQLVLTRSTPLTIR